MSLNRIENSSNKFDKPVTSKGIYLKHCNFVFFTDVFPKMR